MRYISSTTDFNYKNTVVALGKFEGLHRGHQLLFNHLKEYQTLGYQSVIFTFDMGLDAYLSETTKKVIYTNKERRYLLDKTNIDILIEYPFTDFLRNMSPEAFIEQILINQLDAKVIVVGSDFHFGYNRSGSTTLLKELASKYGYLVVELDKLKYQGQDVSSSRIRECLNKGDLYTANQLLGTPYSIIGEVIHGRKIGRTIGMPTANQIPAPNKFLPPRGVYTAQIIIDEEDYFGVSNIGVKPTIDTDLAEGIETFIFDFTKDIYGKTIEVKLIDYQRPELKFSSLDELCERMEIDVTCAKEFIQSNY